MKKTNVLAALFLAAMSAQPVWAQFDPLAGAKTPAAAGTIVIGSADFPESQLLATIYEQALEGAGLKVETRMNIGSREVYLPALIDGSISLIPEYAGAALSYLDKDNTAHAAEDVVPALAKALPEGITLLAASPAQNADTLAVTRETAAKYGLSKISDLKAPMAELVLGGPPEWKTRHEGVLGLEEVYGLTFKSFRPLDAGGPLTLSALLNGQVQVADLFSTDPAIATRDLVTLEDDQKLFPAQNIVPLVAKAALNDTITARLDAVSAALSTADLSKMNARLAAHESFDTVARDFLKEKGLQ